MGMGRRSPKEKTERIQGKKTGGERPAPKTEGAAEEGCRYLKALLTNGAVRALGHRGWGRRPKCFIEGIQPQKNGFIEGVKREPKQADGLKGCNRKCLSTTHKENGSALRVLRPFFVLTPKAKKSKKYRDIFWMRKTKFFSLGRVHAVRL